MRAETGSGNIEVLNVTGPVDVRASSGDVTGTRLGGDVSAETGSGNITLTLSRPASARAHAGSGDVELTVPAGRYRVKSNVDSGDTEIGVTERPGRITGAGPGGRQRERDGRAALSGGRPQRALISAVSTSGVRGAGTPGDAVAGRGRGRPGISSGRRRAATSSTQPTSRVTTPTRRKTSTTRIARPHGSRGDQPTSAHQRGERHHEGHVPQIDGQRTPVRHRHQPTEDPVTVHPGGGRRAPADDHQDERRRPEGVAQRDVVEVVAARPGMGEDPCPAGPGQQQRHRHQHPVGEPAQHAVVVGEAEQPRAEVEAEVAQHRRGGRQDAHLDRRPAAGTGRAGSGSGARRNSQSATGEASTNHEVVAQVPDRAERQPAPVVGRGVGDREQPAAAPAG